MSTLHNVAYLATAPFAEIDRLRAELERSRACEARLKQVIQDFIDKVESGRARSTESYNAMRDALDFCSNYDTYKHERH